MPKPAEGDGGGDGGAGGNADPAQQPAQQPDPQPADDFKAKYEAEKTAREAAEKKLVEATKGRLTDAERIAALETDYTNLIKTHEAMNANFTALKTTFEAEQEEKKKLTDQERAELVAKLKEARPGLNDANLNKCDILFLRDLAKNVLPPEASARDIKQEAAKTERDKRIAELREQRKAKNKR